MVCSYACMHVCMCACVHVCMHTCVIHSPDANNRLGAESAVSMADLPLSLIVNQVLGRTPPAPTPPFGAVAAWHLSALDHRPTSWRENQLTILQVLGVIAHACCAGRDTPCFF